MKDMPALKATTWTTIDLRAPARAFLTEFEAGKLGRSGATPWLLGALADLYQRCLGLVAQNASCPRIVGDRQMAGQIASLSATADCQRGYGWQQQEATSKGDARSSVAVGGCSGGVLFMFSGVRSGVVDDVGADDDEEEEKKEEEKEEEEK